MATTISCDVAIVGAGLAGGLIALALAKRHPDLDVRLIDGGDSVGGNHLWSFFGSDVAAADRWIVEPMVTYGWRGYDVAFPHHARTIDATYYSIESSALDREVRAALPPERLMLGRKAMGVSATAVMLADGDRIEAGGVVKDVDFAIDHEHDDEIDRAYRAKYGNGGPVQAITSALATETTLRITPAS